MPNPLPVRPFRFVTPTPLRWVDVDSEGIVNHAVYLSLMEQARFCYFEQLGLLRGGNVPFVLAEATVGFVRPGRLGMDVSTAAAVTQIGRTSFRMEYEVRGDGSSLATGRHVLVYVNQDFEPIEVADLARVRIAAFEEWPEGTRD